ncbi:MAG: hypothetical protein IPH12_14070 [Saprospirales bacterium]|nr:hypothetical protein [Saprospirales bacterium]
MPPCFRRAPITAARSIWEPLRDKADPCAAQEAPTIHYLPGADPYSFWATVAIPGWTKRFRSIESRRFFEQLLYQETPALVGLNILWLSPHDMCKFEDEYKRWLEWLECPDIKRTCVTTGAPPQFGIVDCIRQLRTTAPCPAPDTAVETCGCPSLPSARPAVSGCCAIPFEPEGSLFWADCPAESIGANPHNQPSVGLISDAAASAPAIAAIEQIKPAPKKIRGDQPDQPVEPAAGPRQAANGKTADIRKRRSQYLNHIQDASTPKMRESKSFAMIGDYMRRPTVSGFRELVEHLAKHNLKKGKSDSENPYLTLAQNCLWHLFDQLALETVITINKKIENELKTCISTLVRCGFDLASTAEAWKSADLLPKADAIKVNRLLRLLQKT